MKRTGFTLIEMLVVIAIISILASVVLASIHGARKRAYYNRAVLEMRQMETALFLYSEDHGYAYPDDVTRSIPPGLEAYLHNPSNLGAWPNAPFPGSVYDWDNWDIAGEKVYQISIRFCNPSCTVCHYPDEPWATGFDCNSSMYWCIKGPCRSHSSELATHPGHCVNCPTP